MAYSNDDSPRGYLPRDRDNVPDIGTTRRDSESHLPAFPSEDAASNLMKIAQRLKVTLLIDSGRRLERLVPSGVSVVFTGALR